MSADEAAMDALVAEYASVLAEREHWAEQGYEPWKPAYRMGARSALERVARRLGVHDLAARVPGPPLGRPGGKEERGGQGQQNQR